jgi:hypothetical protein
VRERAGQARRKHAGIIRRSDELAAYGPCGRIRFAASSEAALDGFGLELMLICA